MLILSRDFSMSSSDKSMVSAAALWGAVMGQLGFGLVADKVRYKEYEIVLESMINLVADDLRSSATGLTIDLHYNLFHFVYFFVL
jgi:hypothetical protein